MKLKKIFISLIILIIVPGCISSFFKEAAPTFSDNIIYADPKPNFIRLTSYIYPAWKNTKNGSVISLVSDCTENLYDLKTIHTLINDSLDQFKVIAEKMTQLETGHPSYYRRLQGQIDSKPVEVQVYSFQHKKCNYLTSLSGDPKKVSADLETFQIFNKQLSFKK